MRPDRVALFLAIGMPLLAFALLAWTFSNAVIRDLRVSVVDADRTPTSMIYVQAIASAPGVTVAQRVGRPQRRDACDPLGRCDRGGLYPARLRARPHRKEASADRRLLQPAVFHARQQRGERAIQRDRRGDGEPAADLAGRAAPASRRGPWSSSNMC